MLSEAVRTSLKLFASVPILASQQPRFKLDYYVRSIERVKQVSASQCDVIKDAIEAAFVGMDSATLQRANVSDRE